MTYKVSLAFKKKNPVTCIPEVFNAYLIEDVTQIEARL